jgi:signal peptidase I
MRIKPRYRILILLVLVILVLPSYLRVFRVHGSSDAPSYLMDDLILVNRAAYDFRLPYTSIVISTLSDPEPGDVVLFRDAEEGYLVFKRVVGGPGDTVAMVENHVMINETPLYYELLDASGFGDIPSENKLGSIIAHEIGNGPEYTVTYTPDAGSRHTFQPVTVPDGHYFLLGDNRDNSEDSRMYGPVSRDAILGKVSGAF